MTALSPDMPAPPGKGRSPERRDPAWRGRLAGAAVALFLLWPMLVLTEFKPWLLLAPDALTPSLRFLADFMPPRLDAILFRYEAPVLGGAFDEGFPHDGVR